MAQAYIESAKLVKAKMEEAEKTVQLIEEAGGLKTTFIQSDKLGYDWENFYVNDILVKQVYVEQKNPSGTADNPIKWVEGMVLITNAFYTHEGVRKVWTGKNGEIAPWDDNRWEVF